MPLLFSLMLKKINFDLYSKRSYLNNIPVKIYLLEINFILKKVKTFSRGNN